MLVPGRESNGESCRQDPDWSLADPGRHRGARRRCTRHHEQRLRKRFGDDRRSTVEHGGRGVLQRHRHAGRHPDVGLVRGSSASWSAARPPRGLHRADGLNVRSGEPCARGGGAARLGAGWETAPGGIPRALSPSFPSARPGRQSSNRTVTGSPVSTPSPSGSNANALAAALAASALLSCERTPVAT